MCHEKLRKTVESPLRQPNFVPIFEPGRLRIQSRSVIQSTAKFGVEGTTRVMLFSTQDLYISSVWNHEKRFLIKVSENRHLT